MLGILQYPLHQSQITESSVGSDTSLKESKRIFVHFGFGVNY